MDNVSLKLQEIFFTKVFVETIQGHKKSNFDESVALPEYDRDAFELDSITPEYKRYAVVTSLSFNSEKEVSVPYCIQIECMAFFEVPLSFEFGENLKELYRETNPVITGSIRELVASLTSRQVYGAYLLGI